MRLKRKAAFLMYPLLIGLFLAISIYTFTKYVEQPPIAQEFIGDFQLNLLGTSHEAEKALLYIDQSAKYAAEQSLYDLTKLGGGDDCGTSKGISLWSRSCFPDYKKNYMIMLDKNLEGFMEGYGLQELPKHNYEYVIDKSKILGVAMQPLLINVTSNKGDNIGKYAIKPSFSVDAGVDMTKIFSDLKFYVLDSAISGRESILTKTSACIGNEADMLWLCVKSAADHFEKIMQGYSVDFEPIASTTYKFDISTDKKVLAYDLEDKKADARDLVASFAIDFSQLEEVPEAVPGEIIDISGIPFEFDQSVAAPGEDVKQGIVYLKDVWDVAKQENVNYYLVLAIIATESNFRYTNKIYDGKAHGVMQMFKPAVRDIFPELVSYYTELDDIGSDFTQDYIMTSSERYNVMIQIHAGTLYVKKVKSYLANAGKPTNSQTIIQAYHDGIGYITKTGESTFCDLNTPEACEESNKYYAKVSGYFSSFVEDEIAIV